MPLQINLKLQGREGAILALAAVDRDARFSQFSAMRTTARTARGDSVRDLASRSRIVQKIWRKRLRAYWWKKDRGGLMQAKLWLGLKLKMYAKEHQDIAALLRQVPGSFPAVMPGGHRGIFVRPQETRPYGPRARKHPRERGALPIRELSLSPLDYGADAIMIAQAQEHMRNTYPAKLRSEFLRRLTRRRARR